MINNNSIEFTEAEHLRGRTIPAIFNTLPADGGGAAAGLPRRTVCFSRQSDLPGTTPRGGAGSGL
jgi:hypothetical protein